MVYGFANGVAQAGAVSYKHAYYLFLADKPIACEACYVPLLITQNTLEKIGADHKKEDGVLIITYERDSIWQNKGRVSIDAINIENSPRIVRINNRRYRYQEISATEVIKLLENPMGTIPISRIGMMPVDGPDLADLVKAFKSTN